MKVYRVTCIDNEGDKCNTYLAQMERPEEDTVIGFYDECDKLLKPFGLRDDDIHFYLMSSDEIKNGECETDEFKYKLLKEIKNEV